MANSEIVLRRILGPIRADVRPLALAVDITEGLIFEQRIAIDDIKVTKHVYPPVAKLLHQKIGAVTKSIERLTRICWRSLEEQELTEYYFGRPLRQTPTPREMLTFLAVYSGLNTPFFAAIEREPALLFREPVQQRSDMSYRFVADAIQKSIPVPVTAGAGPAVCPDCGATLERERQNYCDCCGQRLDWGQWAYGASCADLTAGV